MEKFQWSFFSSYFPESAIKNNMLLVKEDAMERKKRWLFCLTASQPTPIPASTHHLKADEWISCVTLQNSLK